MDIVVTREETLSVFALRGRLDAVSAPELEERLNSWFNEPAANLVFDLSGLDYISSAGLRVFLTAAKKIKSRNGKLGMSQLKPNVQEVFTISGFIALIPAFESLEAATQAVR